MRTRIGWWCLIVLLLAATRASAQAPGVQIKGTVSDQSGAAIPGATVTVTGQGIAKTFSTNEVGVYTISGLPPGKYTVRLSSFGFSPAVKPDIEIAAGKSLLLDAKLTIAVEKQEVTVAADSNAVSTDATSNAGAIVLREADLQALSDDPDDLESDLQALAGPSAGPDGGQIFIDGFSNGKLPPKSSIREIRINQNPFSSEYDRLGFGRIEVFTKPGTDNFHGQAFFSDSNNVFNARNPFSDTKPDFDARYFGGNLSGPINKKASFFLDVQRRQISDDALIYSTQLDTNFLPAAVNQTVATPQRRTEVSPRLDYQLTPKNTLVVRYDYERNDTDNAGVGGFSLLSQAYNTAMSSQNVQATETAMLSARAVNETRVQFIRDRADSYGNNTVPTLNVSDSFSGGGSQVGRAWNTDDNWEFQNYTSWTQGRHSLKAGARFRYSDQSDYSPRNFGGTFIFNGGPAPQLDSSYPAFLDASQGQITSIQRYARTLYFEQLGYSPTLISQLGGGASQFSISAGNPLATVAQADVGAFFQDDWRVKTNFTLSLGLRYETQSNIHDWTDFAPRVGFAWAPGAKKGVQKTVIRGGSGIFYNRFADSNTLATLRYNGTTQQQYIVINPNFFPNVLPISQLNAQLIPQTIRVTDPNLHAPYIIQDAISLERQLPKNTTAALTLTDSRGERIFRSTVLTQASGPLAGDRVYEYQSNGSLWQNQLIANVSSRMTKNISLNTFYVFNHARSNTDGVNSFPANPNDLEQEWGRSSSDVRHRFMLMGSMATKHYIRFSPFIMASSGAPFNLTLGQDLFGDGLMTARPSLASAPGPGVVTTPFGMFNLNPAPGATMIPRNYGQGPGNFSVNFRLSKTFGFGPVRGEAAAATPGGGPGPGGARGGFGGPGGGGRGPGGPGGIGMGGRGGFGGGDTTDRRFNLTLSASARNVFNHVNLRAPDGNLSSPLFGQSLALANSGPGGSTANNRRLELQLRLSF